MGLLCCASTAEGFIVERAVSFVSARICSGAEAVDNAIKIARAATGRQNIVAFEVCKHALLSLFLDCHRD